MIGGLWSDVGSADVLAGRWGSDCVRTGSWCGCCEQFSWVPEDLVWVM